MIVEGSFGNQLHDGVGLLLFLSKEPSIRTLIMR